MNYRNTNFISAEPVLAEVQEELGSYMEAGAITPMMFPTYIDQCLRKLNKQVLKSEEAMIQFENYTTFMPDDFHQLNYAMMFQVETTAYSTGRPISLGWWSKSITCTGNCPDDSCTPTCDPTFEIYEQISTDGGQVNTISYSRPTWIRVYYGSRDMCTKECPNLKQLCSDVITIGENRKVTATFSSGCVYVKYYSRPQDDQGVPLIPEILEVEEYIKSYIKYKMFEKLWHSAVDETSRQIETKLQYYKQETRERLASVKSILKQETTQQNSDNIVAGRLRFKKYHIS